ncbi:hypothetical protein MY04_1212 [Flammeovirga sp. MY04]|uniref:hypothetical protein n=1 Tax=Flammeovirga sp. MY04 TaxID=1191459 RepID=UPI00080637DA|nr:hypothetical protein [Flammeovirga sp. MY04]ANQ48589.1 hypothetical protein MY04_1212 [Flammeovirga sp. MY04]
MTFSYPIDFVINTIINKTKLLLFTLIFISFSAQGQNDSLNVNNDYQLSFYSKATSDSLGSKEKMYNRYHMEKSLVLITGVQIHANQFGEIGLGVMKNVMAGHHPATFIYGVSNELKFSNDLIWGLKAGVWLGGGMNIGLNLVNYTDFKNNSLRFRPEIGAGLWEFRIVYGYNFAITNREFEGINTHNFTLNLMLRVKKIKKIIY